MSVDEAVGEHGKERGMGAEFVKIGARYMNLSAMLCRFVTFQRQLLTTAILEGVVHEYQTLLRLLLLHFDP